MMSVINEANGLEPDWAFLKRITRPALLVASPDYLRNIRANLEADEVVDAVAERDTPWIFEWLIGVSQFQGISDANAASFTAKHGAVSWHDLQEALSAKPACSRLQNYWTFSECGYRKAKQTCAEPRRFPACSLPRHPARKGSLIQAAHALFLFVRDVCGGDLISWIDGRLADADLGFGAPNRARVMGAALVEPLSHVYGIGPKVWSMALADILLAADFDRERWVTTGAGMVVVDSLLHNHFHRTGVLRRFGAEHPYGPRCYAPGGCADLIRGLAQRVDAREFNPSFPTCFPRLVQFAVWRLCSTSEMNHCNGNQIDDRLRCQNLACPTFRHCDRIALREALPTL
jgi:hypothetical protein